MKCGTVECESEAWALVYWPGQLTRMCQRCTTRALGIAQHMGFTVPVFVFSGDERITWTCPDCAAELGHMQMAELALVIFGHAVVCEPFKARMQVALVEGK